MLPLLGHRFRTVTIRSENKYMIIFQLYLQPSYTDKPTKEAILKIDLRRQERWPVHVS